MIITVCLNPAVDKMVTVDCFVPGETNRVLSVRRDPGGKAINVAKMVRRLGGDTLALGIVGGENGAYIRSQLSEMGIPHDFVTREEPTRTNYKIADKRQRSTTELNEPGYPITEQQLEKVWKSISAHVRPGDTVVLAGTNPPGVADDTLARWIDQLNAMQAVTVLDTSGAPLKLGIAAKPRVIKPNMAELSELFGEQIHYLRDAIAAAKQIVQGGVERVIVSLGGDGAIFATKEGVLRGHGVDVPVCSTVGCGDVMLASLLYDLQRETSWEETARRAIATGTANATCSGTEPPTVEQIEEFLDRVQIERL
ncbi:MAG: 1-phosphofructokinase [Oscillospiraceae bacterium]|nr:1-phosphofructokinase [Oscillospiraceae bacterium]